MKHSHRKEVRSSTDTSSLIEDALALRSRDTRDARRQFLVEGVRAINLAMEFDALETLFYAPSGEEGTRFLASEARARGVRCLQVEDAELRAMAHGEDAQGVVGIARQQTRTLLEANAHEGVWLALETLNDDGNLGTMLRTAEASGARGLIACGAEVDFWAPKAVRASMGALFCQTLVRASWREMRDFQAATNARWIGTALMEAEPYDKISYGKNFWLWMGDERDGLSPRALAACDALAFIPMSGRVDSLNVGVAAGVVLFGAQFRGK